MLSQGLGIITHTRVERTDSLRPADPIVHNDFEPVMWA